MSATLHLLEFISNRDSDSFSPSSTVHKAFPQDGNIHKRASQKHNGPSWFGLIHARHNRRNARPAEHNATSSLSSIEDNEK
ncbi:hypothetical protein M408DRAFT_327455, partial [Serendipita vermifera MAFF 305830]